jgi:hypothetical protein
VQANSGFDIDLLPATRLVASRDANANVNGYRINSAGVIVSRGRQIWPQGATGGTPQDINSLLAPESATTIDFDYTITNANEILADAHDGAGDADVVVLRLATVASPARLYKVVESDPRIDWMIPVGMNDNGLITATAFFKDSTDHAVLLVPAELMVDGNRDGEMSFDDPAVHDGDQTSESRPYRFWLNDDDDGAAGEPGDHVPPRAPDYADGTIRSIRDLEDFARLHVNVAGFEAALESNTVQAAFEWRQTSNNPRIKLYRATSAGTNYLTDEAAANSALLFPFRDTLGEVAPGAPLFMPSGFWVKNSGFANVPKTLPIAWFLFEASGEGKGQLVLSFWKDGRKIGETPGVWLDIRNVKTLYQHQVLGGQDPWNGANFEPDRQEEEEVIIFVHGWRLSPADTANFAETMFKRMWWRGYKGRFAAVRWDTYYNATDHGWVPYVGQAVDAYLGKYNDSEHNAWLTGEVLKEYVDELPGTYRKHIVAHSMGNVVTASALERGMTVDTYALLNAAIPAACYDDRSDLQPAPTMKTAGPLGVHLWDTQTTPDDDPDPLTRRLAYRGRLMNVSGNLVSFFLPNDFATSYAWELNNVLTKPPLGLEDDDRREFGLFCAGFNYVRSAPPGQKLTKGGNTLADPNEAEPYACRTWAKAVGAEPNTRGKLSGVGVNMGTPAFGGSNGLDTEHSGEFDRAIQRATPFYKELLNQFGIEQTR